jgi:hypothetical protein
MHPHLVFHPALWAVNLLLWAVCTVWVALDRRISLSPEGWGPLLLMAAVCAMISLYVWRMRHRSDLRKDRLEWPLAVAAGSLFMLTGFLAIRLLNHLTMSMPFPLADDVLARMDEVLGADWYGYATWLGSYPALQPVIRFPYSTTTACAYFVFLALALLGMLERAVEFGSLLFAAALFTVIVAGFLPAEAAMVRYMDPVLASMFSGDAGVYHMAALEALRGSNPIDLAVLRLPGLATFPSFHTIAGLLIVYACRDRWHTLTAASLWTGIMLLATPVYGGHYFVDILAGGLVAAVIIVANTAFRPLRTTAMQPASEAPQEARHSA